MTGNPGGVVSSLIHGFLYLQVVAYPLARPRFTTCNPATSHLIPPSQTKEKMNIHMPSVASSPNPHNDGLQSSGNAKEDLLALMGEKDIVEAELKALGAVLDSVSLGMRNSILLHPSCYIGWVDLKEQVYLLSIKNLICSDLCQHKVTMQTPLCTFDGYPRDDIDVAQIRITRSRIIHLRNDYKGLMNKIEKGLHAHHATIAASLAAAAPSSITPPSSVAAAQLIEAPFARVNTVAPGSPAADAGLQPGDHIKRFGSANVLNHARLAKVAEVVGQSEGVSATKNSSYMHTSNGGALLHLTNLDGTPETSQCTIVKKG